MLDPEPVGAPPLLTTRDELRAYLAADNVELQGMRDFVVGRTKKLVYGRGIPLLQRDTPAVNALLDEWLAELSRG